MNGDEYIKVGNQIKLSMAKEILNSTVTGDIIEPYGIDRVEILTVIGILEMMIDKILNIIDVKDNNDE